MTTATAYARKLAREGARHRDTALEGRELTVTLPPCADPARRRRCRKSLRAFAETYFPNVFNKPWSDDHLIVIAALEAAIHHGNRLALAMARGSGKTALLAVAALWAIFAGKRKYVVLIAADIDKSQELLATLKTHLAAELLSADFPEICHPFKSLNGATQARRFWQGQPISMKISKDRIDFPTIPGSPAYGATIACESITGAIRGLQKATADGFLRRPDLVLVDDPQTDESAKSVTQTEDRLRTLNGAILGLAGPGEPLAIFAAVTVIRPNDLAAQILDHQRYPAWRGIKLRMVDFDNFDEWQKRDDLIEYWQIRKAELIANPEGDWPQATEFWTEHRSELEAGATARWSARYNARREVSAIQHAADIFQDSGRQVFLAEFQNSPEDDTVTDETTLSVGGIIARLNRLKQRTVPTQATHLTAFVDVQAALLYWMVIAVDNQFTSWILDYGAWPRQRLRQFQLRNVGNNIDKVYHDQPTLEGRLTAAMRDLFDELLGRDWLAVDGTTRSISRLMIDAQWGSQTETVYNAVRSSPHRSRILPSHGKFIGASSDALVSQWRVKSGEIPGEEWRMSWKRGLQSITWDTNHWKTAAAARLRATPGSPGSATLFGGDAEYHRMLAEHCTSERAVMVESKNRRCHEWKATGADNHLWDCFVGAHVCASTLGAKVTAATPAAGSQKPKRSLAEMRAAKRRQK